MSVLNKPAIWAGVCSVLLSLPTPTWAQNVEQDIEQNVAPMPIWQLHKGVPVHTQLQTWAERSAWTLDWQPKISWLVAGDVEFEGEFEKAIKEVIEGLFFEGKPVRLVLWEGNRLAEVVSSDAR